MENIILRKGSDESQIKAYFTKVLELKKTGEEFPVDLDAVWPIIYHAKKKAVFELLHTKDDFGNLRYIERIDYQTSPQKVQAGKHNKTIVNKYYLSVSGLEWFIARKVRPVFEVYRQVFHSAVALQQQLSWHGLPTIYNAGVVYVSYMGVLRMCHYSTYSGAVATRKRMHSTQFAKFFNQNFITVAFAELLRQQSEVRQLALTL